MKLMEMNPKTESALSGADAIRLQVSPTLDPKRRSDLGQFMTPASVAMFIAGMFDKLPSNIRLLDAGAGVGSLTAAFVREACSRDTPPKSIDVTVFEIDALLGQYLAKTMAACADECNNTGVKFSYRIIPEDYILHSAAPLLTELSTLHQYDCAILNPPYAKISSSSKCRKALRQMGIETSNLYTAFVAVALTQLNTKGQLVAITPRSFCNGSYFEPFRRFLLERAELRKVHVYVSRKQAFKDDDVLQENIIYQLVKSSSKPQTVSVSSSESPNDLQTSTRMVPFDEVVVPTDPHLFIRLAVSEADGDHAQRVRTLPCMLSDLGLTVSTGRVVDFRVRDHLRKDPETGAAPLIYPAHFEKGSISWPKLGIKKPNALALNTETVRQMVPRGIYVLTKRFSSKEEKRRLVAAIYHPELIDADLIGFENHLNYFHLNGKGLPADLAAGLALFLNSTAVDQYFRQFSGHTQVNATDLRNLHYPTAEQLKKIGQMFVKDLPTQEDIDKTVNLLL